MTKIVVLLIIQSLIFSPLWADCEDGQSWDSKLGHCVNDDSTISDSNVSYEACAALTDTEEKAACFREYAESKAEIDHVTEAKLNGYAVGTLSWLSFLYGAAVGSLNSDCVSVQIAKYTGLAQSAADIVGYIFIYDKMSNSTKKYTDKVLSETSMSDFDTQLGAFDYMAEEQEDMSDVLKYKTVVYTAASVGYGASAVAGIVESIPPYSLAKGKCKNLLDGKGLATVNGLKESDSIEDDTKQALDNKKEVEVSNEETGLSNKESSKSVSENKSPYEAQQKSEYSSGEAAYDAQEKAEYSSGEAAYEAQKAQKKAEYGSSKSAKNSYEVQKSMQTSKEVASSAYNAGVSANLQTAEGLAAYDKKLGRDEIVKTGNSSKVKTYFKDLWKNANYKISETDSISAGLRANNINQTTEIYNSGYDKKVGDSTSVLTKYSKAKAHYEESLRSYEYSSNKYRKTDSYVDKAIQSWAQTKELLNILKEECDASKCSDSQKSDFDTMDKKTSQEIIKWDNFKNSISYFNEMGTLLDSYAWAKSQQNNPESDINLIFVKKELDNIFKLEERSPSLEEYNKLVNSSPILKEKFLLTLFNIIPTLKAESKKSKASNILVGGTNQSDKSFKDRIGSGPSLGFGMAGSIAMGKLVGPLIASASRSIAKKLALPAFVSAFSGLNAVMNGILAKRSYTDMKRTQEQAKKLRDAKQLFSQTALNSCISSRDDYTKLECYCYDDDGGKNVSRSNACDSLWTSMDESLFVEDNAVSSSISTTPLGCVSVDGVVDISCSCQDTNSCTSPNVNGISVSSGGGNILSSSMAKSLGSLYTGKMATAEIDPSTLLSNAIKERAKQKKAIDTLLKNSNKTIADPFSESSLDNAVKMFKADELATYANQFNPMDPTSSYDNDINKAKTDVLNRLDKSLKDKGLTFKKPNSVQGKNKKKNTSAFSFGAESNNSKSSYNSALNSALNKKYDYGDSDIGGQQESIWDNISSAYNKSGLKRLFGD